MLGMLRYVLRFILKVFTDFDARYCTQSTPVSLKILSVGLLLFFPSGKCTYVKSLWIKLNVNVNLSTEYERNRLIFFYASVYIKV